MPFWRTQFTHPKWDILVVNLCHQVPLKALPFPSIQAAHKVMPHDNPSSLKTPNSTSAFGAKKIHKELCPPKFNTYSRAHGTQLPRLNNSMKIDRSMDHSTSITNSGVSELEAWLWRRATHTYMLWVLTQPMNRENWPPVTDELVEFEKQTGWKFSASGLRSGRTGS